MNMTKQEALNIVRNYQYGSNEVLEAFELLKKEAIKDMKLLGEIPNIEPPILKGLDKNIIELSVDDLEQNLRKIFNKACASVFEELLHEYEHKKIEENNDLPTTEKLEQETKERCFAVNRGGFNCSVKHNDLCTNNEPLFIDVPIGTETKINYRQENQLGIHYSFLVEGNDFIIYKNLADGYYYHAGNKVTSNKCNIIDKIVQEYEKDNMSGKYTGDAEKQNSGCFEKVLINVPLIGNFKVKYKEPSDGKLFYGLVYEDIVKEFMLLDEVIYHQGAEVTNQCGKKVKQIINDYEAGLAKGEEKKTCTFMFHENARVIDVSPHWSNGVRYTIGNNGNNYVIDRLTNCEFYHGNYLVAKESSEKLKDLIIDYWTNKNI